MVVWWRWWWWWIFRRGVRQTMGVRATFLLFFWLMRWRSGCPRVWASRIGCLHYLPCKLVISDAALRTMNNESRNTMNMRARSAMRDVKGLTICTLIEIVCLPVLIFTYSHVENALFFALDLVVFCNSNYFFKHTNWYTLTSTTFSNIPIDII